ncbi:unnamed protein product [Hymenolepis diminuta]|uniref:Uncharacterized protein n=1 Tax=Hymenolepis diminuta TaxID=6216 RepID=A0A0R3SZC1_HYMDI|nr:unnamed protein product [Hymenolepis diminuta]
MPTGKCLTRSKLFPRTGYSSRAYENIPDICASTKPAFASQVANAQVTISRDMKAPLIESVSTCCNLLPSLHMHFSSMWDALFTKPPPRSLLTFAWFELSPVVFTKQKLNKQSCQSFES